MAINIAKYIGELLYDHDTVIIPALGAIAATYESASIDHVQGLLHPPSKVLSFNKNLVLDDGVLTNYLQEEAEVSLSE
ncbi:MAG: SPOR domain-containing protein, partial [Saprospiraceae bacterium]